MSDLPFASQGADELTPPGETHALVSVTTSAQAIDLAALFNAAEPGLCKRGGFWITLEPRGGIAYVRFRAAGVTAGTTAGNGSNGKAIQDCADGRPGQPYFWRPTAQPILDVIGAANHSLYIVPSSPNYGNRAPR